MAEPLSSTAPVAIASLRQSLTPAKVNPCGFICAWPETLTSTKYSANAHPPELCRPIFRLHLDTDALEKSRRQNSAGAHDDGIIFDLHVPSPLLDLDIVATDFFDAGLKHDTKLAGFLCDLDPLPIFQFGARKGLAPVGQGHGGPGLLSYAGSGFERTVAAPDHQHVAASILLRVDQAVNHFGLILPFHFQLSRRAPSSDGKQHGGRSVRGTGCPDLEFGIGLRDCFDLLAVIDLQPSLACDILPKPEQFFLAHFFKLDLTDQR